MEHMLGDPPPVAIPPEINTAVLELLHADSVEIIIKIHEQFRSAHAYRLLDAVMEYSGYISEDDEATNGEGPRVLTQGMFFALYIADEWLEEDELIGAAVSVPGIQEELEALGKEMAPEGEEEPEE